MIHVYESAIIDQPISRVWDLLRDFNAHDKWHPAVASSTVQDNRAADQVGAVRDFMLTTGERVCEQLLKLSDCHYSFSYTITESDVPLHNYVAHVELKPVTSSDATFWRWTSKFDAPDGREDEFRELVATGIYRSGFQGAREFLQRHFPLEQGIPSSTTPHTHTQQAVSSSTGNSTHDTNLNGLEGKGIVVSQYGDASVLSEVATVAAPPAAGEVRLQQDAIGLNFIDVYCRSGYFNLIDPPGIPGMEAAGIVVDCGAGVTRLKPGDRVAYACAPPGAYTSVRTLNADLVMSLPEHIDNLRAAAVMLKGITAWFLLNRVHHLQADETALIYAPAGGVGKLLVQWASHLGATVIGATSSAAKVDAARRAGATHVVTPGQKSLVDQVMELVDGNGVDVVFDAVGRDTFEYSREVLRPGGHLVSYGQASGDIGMKDIGEFAAKSLQLSRPNYGHYTDTRENVSQACDALWGALQRDEISVDIDQTFALSEAADAHRLLEAGKTTGSTLLLPEGIGATHG